MRARIAYCLMEFPAVTETFVTTECDLLERLGFEIVPFSLRKPADDLVSPTWRKRTVVLGLDPTPLGVIGRRFPSRLRAALGFVRDHLRLSPSEGAFAARSLIPAARIALTCLEQRVDALHTHFERGAAILTGLSSILAGVPWSFTAHAFGVYLSEPRALAFRCRAASFVRASHGVLADRLLALAPGADVRVIPTPIDVENLPVREPRPTERIRRVVTVARDVPKKGLDLVEPLVRALAARGMPVHVDVIGPLARSRSPHPTVTRSGPLPHAETLRRIAAADFVMQPCRVADNGDRDGVPLCLIEALAIGTPAYSTRVGGIPELFGQLLRDHLASPDDVAGLANAIVAGESEPRAALDRLSEARAVTQARYGANALELLAEALAVRPNHTV